MSRQYTPDALDPELAPVAAMTPSPDYSDIAAGRVTAAQAVRFMPPADLSGVEVSEREIPGPEGAPDVPVRLYRPASAEGGGPVPGMVFFHWGGFVLGDLETEHARCARYAREAGCLVVSVDYRLAPEHPFPAGLEDCYAALAWTAAEAEALGVDPGRIAVGGTSAGGGLAAAVCLVARDRGGPRVAFQLLGYPVLDDRTATPSAMAFGDTPNWTTEANRSMWRYYLGDEGVGTGGAGVSPYAAPYRADDLSGLPPAYVWTAEFDPLRDEGLEYACRLLRSGVPVEVHNFAGTFHGFDQVQGAGIARGAREEQVRAIRRALAPTPPALPEPKGPAARPEHGPDDVPAVR